LSFKLINQRWFGSIFLQLKAGSIYVEDVNTIMLELLKAEKNEI